MRFLVTAGPTREPIDAVRYLSNASSGRMGFACAEAAARAGHEVVLVTGPVDLPDPAGVEVVRVTTGLEMHRAATKAFAKADAVIATAAVCDYRPAKRAAGKLKKGVKRVSMALVPNPDILLEMGRKKGRRVLIGFALEVQRPLANATDKLWRKNLDAIVLNRPTTFGGEDIAGAILGPEDSKRRRVWRLDIPEPGMSKSSLAETLVRLAEQVAAR